MKKFQLQIPQPCHENWNEMKPEEKGRYCGSCSKTVIDFSVMSDRDIAQFFKKKKTDVCGHFMSDQLQREILIPRKRIPWHRYFFQIAWPAMVMALKACTGDRRANVGKVKVERLSGQQQSLVTPSDTYGMVGGLVVTEVLEPISQKKAECVPSDSNGQQLSTMRGDVEIVPIPPTVDVVGKPDTDGVAIYTVRGTTFGKIYRVPVKNSHGAIALPDVDTMVDMSIDTSAAVEGMSLEPVTLFPNDQSNCYMLTGAVVMSSVRITEVNRIPEAHVSQTDKSISVFPNPARSGGQITISVTHGSYKPIRILLFEASGQKLMEQQTSVLKYSSSMRVSLPQQLAAGNYFLSLVDDKGETRTQQVIIQ